MGYDFSQLSFADFEDLCRDLIGKENGIRFEAFGSGPDGGIDGRHAKGESCTILQAKHYRQSGFQKLKTTMQKERLKIDVIVPSRYIVATSQSLTPANKTALKNVIGSYLKSTADLFGCEDINGLLRKFPEIEKSHLKIWLSNTAVLERILHAGLEEFTQTTKHELLKKLKTYVTNPSLKEARELLQKYHVLIISGYAGVGKTTLAEILTYEFLADNWNFYAIRSLDEGFAKIDDSKPMIFLFDDFLGRVDLDKQSLRQRDSALAKFVDRVRRSPNARFVLTTREHIFREAGVISDYIDDPTVQLSKYILDVGSYTRRIKSHIFFNHLAASDLSDEHFKALLEDKYLPKIIDHPNYSPRLIATVSSESIDLMISPEKYPDFVIETLNRPEKIWDKPFQSLDIKCQHLLLTLFFASEYGENIDNLRIQYEQLHKILCQEYSSEIKPKDFETSLKILESGFVAIKGKRISYINPALRDYMKAYLNDPYLLKHLPKCAIHVSWTRYLWEYVKTIFNTDPEKQKFVALFSDFAQGIHNRPVRKSSSKHPWDERCDLDLGDRIELLMEWWRITKLDVFEKAIHTLCQDTNFQIGDWGYGIYLPSLIQEFYDDYNDGFINADEVITALSEKLVEIIESGISTEDLVGIKEAVECLDPFNINSCDVEDAVKEAIECEFDNIDDIIQVYSSESELVDHIEYLKKLSDGTDRNLSSAINIVNEKIIELSEQRSEYEEPSGFSSRDKETEKFDDADMRSLFATLVKF